MKIAFLTGSLNRGGMEVLLLNILKSVTNEFEVILISRKGGKLFNEFIQTNKKIILLGPSSIIDITYFFRLRKLIRNEKILIVHSHQHLDSFLIYLACFGLGIKKIQTIHDSGKIARKGIFLIINKIFRLTDLYVFVSSTQRDNYPKYPYRLRENIVLYNGIDLIRFHPKVNTKVNDIVKEDHSIILGSVGNFTPVRDQMFLCRFLKLLDLRNVPFRFYFIGSRSPTNPELFESCRNFCFENGLEDKVFFLGDREDVPDVLGNLDAFLYATKYDTFGIAVVEALAMGIPVFLNDWTTFVEITDSGKHAIIYRTDDVQDLMDRFKEFSQKREHFKHQFQLQSKYIRDKFSIEEHVKQLREVYNDFLN